MVCILLLIVLFLLFWMTYKLFEGFLSPSVQLIGMFGIGTFCYAMFSDYWRSELSMITFGVIILTMVSFILGETIGSRIKGINFSIKMMKCDLNISKKNLYTHRYFIKPLYFWGLTVISLITVYLYFQYTMKLSIAAGNVYGVSRMINFAYHAKNNLTNMPEEPFYVTLGLVISRCFAYYNIFFIILMAIKKEFKLTNIKYLIPITLYILQALLAGGRTQLLRVMIQFLITFFVLERNIKENQKMNFKTFIKIIIVMVIFFVVYRAYGLMRGSLHTGFDEILSYPASPIQAVNIYLEQPHYSSFIGEETLITIRNILRKFGFDTATSVLGLPNVQWYNGSTNIYTAIRRYISDYTILGMVIIIFMLGGFYGYLKHWMIKKNTISSVVLYASLQYPVIEFLFEERFFIGVISAGTVYAIICIWVLQLIIKKE